MSIKRVLPTRTAAASTLLAVEVGHLDVVDVEAVEQRRLLAGVRPRRKRHVRRERARQGERRFALLRREVGVPRREREAVVVADGRDDADLELEVQVADELLDDRGLLRVLLAEVGAVGPDDVEELQADRRDASEVAGPELAFERRAELADVDPGRDSPPGTSPRRTARRGRRRPPPRRASRRAPRRADSGRGPRRSPNCAGLTKRLATTTSFSSRAAANSARCPAWNAPIVGTSPTEPSPCPAARRCVRTIFIGPPAPRSRRPARGTAARARAAARGSLPGAPRPSPSRRARPGPVSSKSFSITRRISGTSASGGAPAACDEVGGRLVERDEVARRDDGARVVERALRVVERERLEPELAREPEADLPRLVALRR